MRSPEVAFQSFRRWQYELALDAETQTQFAAELGFCPLHTWQLEAVSSPIGSSAGYAKLAEHLSQLLADAANSSAAAPTVRAVLRDAHTCRVCCLRHSSERHYIERLMAFVADTRGREAYASAHCLCLPHLARVVEASGGEIAGFLVSGAARRFEEVAEDMRTFAMKTEALRRPLLNEDEDDALFDRIGMAALAPLTIVSALFAPLVFLGDFWAALVGIGLWGLGRGVHESIVPAAVAPMVPVQRRASAYGLFTAGYGVSWFLGSAAIGLLYAVSLPALIAFCLLCEFAAVPLLLVVGSRLKAIRAETGKRG